MEVWHKIMFSKKDKVDSIIQNLSIKYTKSPLPGGHYIITFEIQESDPRWPQISQMIHEKNASDVFNTIFTNSEILQAEWIRLQSVFEQGYPQPKDEWRERTYEGQCPRCGIGYSQKAPFHIEQEPKIGKNDFWSLYWVYTLFCTSKVLQILNLEHIKGYQVWPTIIHSTSESSKTISQLLFPNIANPGLSNEDKLQPELCHECGTTKYLYHKRGYLHFKRDALDENTDFQLTNEWFGSGRYGGFREILISNRLAKLFISNKWRGVSLKPIQLSK